MRFFKWIIQTKMKRVDGDERIIYLANELLKAITAQGYCIRSQGNFGHVDIWSHFIGTDNEMYLDSMANAREQKWRVAGKLTANLIPERDEEVENN